MSRPLKYKWSVYIGAWSLTQWLKYIGVLTVVILAAKYIGVGSNLTPRNDAEAVTVSDNRNLKGQVVHVVDGDTLDFLYGDLKVRVRLNGIDCPEMAQPYGDTARLFTTEACLNQRIVVRGRGRDKYGRILGDVILDNGRVLNRELIKAGLAWWYSKYSDDRELQELERQARTDRLGLWADPTPTAPWDFRARHEN